MRVTNQMMTDNLINNLYRNMNKIYNTQDSISSGKRVSNPSDDPIAMKEIINKRSILRESDQFIINNDEVLAWLGQTEIALNNSEGILTRIKELALSGATGTLNEQDRNNVAIEIDGLYKELLKTANIKYNNKYIFSGQRTLTQPYDDAGTYHGDTETIYRQIDKNMNLELNLTGEKIFNKDGYDIFAIVNNLKDAFEDNDLSGVRDDIADLDVSFKNVLEAHAELGVRTTRADMNKDGLELYKIDTQKLISDLEDLDMAQAIVNFNMQQYVYEAALGAGSRSISKSLVDYLV